MNRILFGNLIGVRFQSESAVVESADNQNLALIVFRLGVRGNLPSTVLGFCLDDKLTAFVQTRKDNAGRLVGRQPGGDNAFIRLRVCRGKPSDE